MLRSSGVKRMILRSAGQQRDEVFIPSEREKSQLARVDSWNGSKREVTVLVGVEMRVTKRVKEQMV